jgi:hypothetical protein
MTDILTLAKINMFDSLMSVQTILTTEVSPEIEAIENNWVRQSNLIYLLSNGLATDKQISLAESELGRLQLTRTKQDGYAEIGYWNGDISQ